MSEQSEITQSALRLIEESPRHDHETLYNALDRLYPWATEDELDSAIYRALGK